MLTKYITIDEFNQYFNEDLELIMGNKEKAEQFLQRNEDRMQTYIDANYNKRIDLMYPEFTDYQKEHYKKALLEQAIYIIRNGELSVQSGTSIDAGKINSRGSLRELSLAENAKQNLILCGLLSRHIGRNIRWDIW